VTGLADDPELVLEVAKGTEYWRHGRVAVSVHGTGDVEVDHWRSGEHTRYTSTLDPAELERLDRELADLDVARLAPARNTYRPDEQTVTVELRRGDEVLHHADLPAGDRESDDRLDRLMTIYDDLVTRVSGGVAPR
jgi:hypothetical protein